MKESMIQVICGPGRGKTTSAIGRGLTALTKGKCVYMVLILDEILGILDEGVISGEELCAIIAQARNAQIQLILTGTIYPDCLNGHVDEVTRIQTRYE